MAVLPTNGHHRAVRALRGQHPVDLPTLSAGGSLRVGHRPEPTGRGLQLVQP
jgi:hypothetical protein